VIIILGLAGYFSLLQDTPDIIINREALPGRSDIIMTIGKIIYFINLIL
jgi:hypothetical protein